MATSVSQPGYFNLQGFTDLGALAVGGRIYTYTQGTTTKKNAYTEATGTTVHTYTSDGVGGEYIALNARGELPSPLYLTSGAYDITLKTATGSTVWTRRADPSGADLATSAGAASIGFIQSGSGALTRTVQAKEREIVSATDFASVQAAHDALSGSGGAIYLPAGNQNITSVTISKQCTVYGVGDHTGGSTVTAQDAASNVFNVTTGGRVSFSGIYFSSAVTRSGGSYIQFDTASSVGSVDDCTMTGWYRGITIGGISDFRVTNVRLVSGVPTTGQGIVVTSGLLVSLDRVICTNDSGARPAAGIAITNTGDVSMQSCSWIQCINGMVLAPDSGQVVTSIRATDTFFDNCGSYGLLAQPTHVTGAVHRCIFTSCWFSSCGTSGVLLDTATIAGTIDGMEFIGCEVFLNTSHGVQVAGTNTKNISFSGGKVAQNGASGFLFGAGVDLWSVTGARIGAVGSLSGNTTYGIQSLGGTSDDVVIEGNTFKSNGTAPLSISSTGARRRIVDNIGYNPVGISSITVGASPYTYTAGDTPETIYVNAGAVNPINIAGSDVFQQTNISFDLDPGQSAIVTYSSLPGMLKHVH